MKNICEEIAQGLKTGKFPFLRRYVILHCKTEEQPQEGWGNRNVVRYEELVGPWITQEEYQRFLMLADISCVLYVVEGPEGMNRAVQEMVTVGEIVPSVVLRIAGIGPEVGRRTACPWVRYVETGVFDTWEEVAEWCGGFSEGTRMGGSFLERWSDPFFSKEYSGLGNVPRDIYAMALFRSLLQSTDLHESVMLGFDCIEFLLASVHYYYKVKQNDQVRHDRKILSIVEHGSELLRLTKREENSRIYPRLTEVLELNEVPAIRKCCKRVGRYFDLDIQSLQLNFFGMLSVLQEVRNHTRGHGVIAGRSGLALWELLFWDIMILEGNLRIEHFHWEVREEQVFCGYGDERLPMAPYLIARGGVPCLLFEQRGNRREYINYFTGEYSIPEIIRPE